MHEQQVALLDRVGEQVAESSLQQVRIGKRATGTVANERQLLFIGQRSIILDYCIDYGTQLQILLRHRLPALLGTSPTATVAAMALRLADRLLKRRNLQEVPS